MSETGITSERVAWDGNWFYAFTRCGNIQTDLSPVPDADRATAYPRFKASCLKCLLTRSPEQVAVCYRREPVGLSCCEVVAASHAVARYERRGSEVLEA
jgi:3'-phosphoadenosine 5'-phosphosulfate sulfotransferase